MVRWYNFGEFRESERIDGALMKEIMRTARSKTALVRDIPLVKTASVLDRAGRRLADSGDPVRKEIMAVMPRQISFSPEMIEAGLDAIRGILDYDNLIKRLEVDLDDARYLDEFTWHDRFRGFFRAMPQGVVSHVSAGNVFVSAVDTLVQGIMTKNVNILKMSSFDPVFPLLFARLLEECDPEAVICPYLSLVPFKGGDGEIEKIIKEESDVVIVYGGREVVEVYRQGRGLHTREVEFGPKYSLAVLDRDALAVCDSDDVACQVARDFTMWEQAACSSPHAVFIWGEEEARRFAGSLKKAFERLAVEFPFPDISIHEKTEITRTRELARVDSALGNSELLIPGIDDQSWTIILEKEPCFKVSCQHRTAYVVTINDDQELYDALAGYGKYIQSVGVLADSRRLFELSDRLVGLGADRVTEIGCMHRRKHGTPHDGTRGLSELVRWASIGHERKFHDPFDFATDDVRDALTLARLNRVLHVARMKSPFYRDRLPLQPLAGLAELSAIPVLEQGDFRSHLPPYGEGLLTGQLGNSISFSSGGTSGKPKFVYRTMAETRRNARGMAKSMALNLIGEGDIVANLFFAGNMWASFVSVNMALEEIGAHVLPIGGHVPMENIISFLRSFKVDAALSIPSVLVGIAQYVEKHGITDLSIRKIGYGGEHMPEATRRYVASVLNTELIRSASYAINDTGVAGYQCAHCTGSVHHVNEDLHILEIVDPETRRPLLPGEAGDIVLTNIDRTLMPVIRYNVGDRGRMVEGGCPCGRTTRRFELLGRSDEVVVIGADNVSIDAIAACVEQVPGLSQYFAIYGKTKNGMDLLAVRVESLEQLAETEKSALSGKLVETILREKPVIAANFVSGVIARPEVTVLAPGELPRNPRTGKIKRVVEERHAG
ncbi:MAG: aldehyde dehydrogenase family protein [Geobacteraceae bacterium]|nr:aldehyde dehydrogenase family protein [Geobacteraceae bacterium]